ncbi:MAG: type II toxin-antitoxin system VapC family toxin [Acidobacteria bacterium]|nr:type II toxin-antitoxin system VapC family toxin [Acidobacteriota bacterium]
MKRRLYLDTSAYLCILLGDAGADRLAQEATGAELCSSVLLVIESRRNLIRLARESVLTIDQYDRCMARVTSDIEHFTLRDMTLDLCEPTPMPAVLTPRSLDLVHLRTAAWFHAYTPLSRFVTLDTAQAQAARELGLPTTS